MPALPTLRRILASLDASLVVEVRWRAGALDRLLDEDHATLVAAVTRLLTAAGWDVRIEVTYAQMGERGSIDILAFTPSAGVLLVIEIKTDMAAVEATLRKIDEKVRLAPAVARARFERDVRTAGWLLVMPERSTLRRRVGRHSSLLDRVFPARETQIRSWIRRPTRAIAGLWFLSPSRPTTSIQRRGGRERVRVPRRPSASHEVAV